MKIKSVELFLATFKLKQTFTTSLGSRDHNLNVFVRLKTDNGLIGWGECSPNPKINGETADTCMAIGQLLGKALMNQDPREHDLIMEIMDKVIYGNTSIKSAFDIACYDLAARSVEQPLYIYLGGSIDKQIYTDYTVSVNDVDKMVVDAQRIKALGFPAIKVKLGDGKEDDVLRIKAIREAIGDAIELRVDANQGWKVKQAIQVLNGLKEFNVQYCEEPINRRNYFKLKKVRKNSATPIMADESLFDHYDARKLIRDEHCDMFNIKLGKSSGLFKAQKIIEEAEKVNMEMQIGGFMGSRLIITANCHLAHTSALIKYFDFDSPLFHSVNPINGGIEYQQDWEVRIPDAPGLGLSVDESFLRDCQRLQVR